VDVYYIIIFSQMIGLGIMSSLEGDFKIISTSILSIKIERYIYIIPLEIMNLVKHIISRRLREDFTYGLFYKKPHKRIT